jgi:hypothetical protein
MGSKSTPTTQTTQYNLAPEQRQILDLAMPGITQFASTVPQRYQGNAIAGFDPLQTQGQNMALGGATAQQGVADTAKGTSDYILGGHLWDPTNNPALSGAVDAAVRPITENYNEVVRPAVRDNFQQAGQVFGGSQRDKANEAIARDYLRNVGDTSSKLVQGEYNTNIDATLKALGLAPQTQATQVTPGVTTSGVGDVRQAMSQALIGQNVSNFNYDQLAPFLQSEELVKLLSSVPGASATTTGNVPQPNQALSALGGAAAGASLGTAIMPGIGTAGGAGLGALLSFLR